MLEKKESGDLPNEIVPKHEELGHVVYSVLEPEHVTESKLWEFMVVGNWNVGAYVVNVVTK